MQGTIGEIRLFAGPFVPQGWASCEGQELPIREYAPLFSLIQTRFGGDGRATFKLPDLRGRAPAGAGQGPGLTQRSLGEPFGAESQTFTLTFQHRHQLRGFGGLGDSNKPHGGAIARSGAGLPSRLSILSVKPSNAPSAEYADAIMATDALSHDGGAAEPRPHSNIPPFLTVQFIICLHGGYPELQS